MIGSRSPLRRRGGRNGSTIAQAAAQGPHRCSSIAAVRDVEAALLRGPASCCRSPICWSRSTTASCSSPAERLPAAHRGAGLRPTLVLHLVWLALVTVRCEQLPGGDRVAGALDRGVRGRRRLRLSSSGSATSARPGSGWSRSRFSSLLLSSLLVRPEPPPQRELLDNPLFFGHVSLALVGYAAFAVAATYGFLFLRALPRAQGRHLLALLRQAAAARGARAHDVGRAHGRLRGAHRRGRSPASVWAQKLYRRRLARATSRSSLTFVTWALYAGALLLRRLRRWQGRADGDREPGRLRHRPLLALRGQPLVLPTSTASSDGVSESAATRPPRAAAPAGRSRPPLRAARAARAGGARRRAPCEDVLVRLLARPGDRRGLRALDLQPHRDLPAAPP